MTPTSPTVLAEGIDFKLDSRDENGANDGDEWIHLVDVRVTGDAVVTSTPTSTPTHTPTRTPTPTHTPTRTPTATNSHQYADTDADSNRYADRDGYAYRYPIANAKSDGDPRHTKALRATDHQEHSVT